MLEQLPGAVQRAAYRMQQTSILLPCLLAQRAARLVAGLDVKEPPPGAVERFRRRYYGLLQHDLANAEAGLYPRSLLFQIPLADYAKTLPRLFGEIRGRRGGRGRATTRTCRATCRSSTTRRTSGARFTGRPTAT